MSEPSCLVIGASHAGAQLASSLRQNGWDGRILVIGDEPYLPYHRPPLSKSFLAGDKHVDDLLIRPGSQYDKVGIEFLLGQRVGAIDRAGKRIALEHGERFSYDKLALATGCRVRRIDLPGADLKGVHYLRNIEDAEAIQAYVSPRKKAVIVGGGYIGLETAALLSGLGLDVTVLEVADRILNRVTAPELSAFYTRVHREEGVDIVTGAAVSAFRGEKRVEAVVCGDGTEYTADLVIVGIGVLPNTALAEAAGLEVDNGIRVDEHCLTSDPDIVAAGDCTSHFNALYDRWLRLESVQNAVDQARVAAATLCGRQNQYNALPWFWSDQFDLKLQIAGLSQGYDDLVLRGDPATGRKLAAFYLRAGKVVAVDAVNSPQEFMFGKRIISGGIEVPPARLADPHASMKDIVAP